MERTDKECKRCRYFVEGIDACMQCGYILSKCIGNDFKFFKRK
jgi:heterodisulfide reductase subunit C